MKKTKNILILIEAMIPFTNYWGGCQRAYYYSRKLKNNGYNVHIICRNQLSIDPGKRMVEGMTVVGLGKNDNDVNNTESSIIRKIKNLIKKTKILKKIVLSINRLLYSEPNILDGSMSYKWAQNNKKYVKNYIESEDIDIVIISGPPFGLFYLVNEIKQMRRKIVLDYRDPWNLWYEKWSFAERIEKKAIRNADLVLTSTDSLCFALKKKYKIQNIYTILNGYNEEQWQNYENIISDSKFVVSYVGNVSFDNKQSFRNTTNFVLAAEEFCKKHRNIEIRFIGVNNIEDCKKKVKNNKFVFSGIVSSSKAIEYIQQSSVLVVLHTAMNASGKYIVCGKLYDYLRSGKPILSIGTKAFANKQMIEKYKAGIHCNDNTNDIYMALENMYLSMKNRNSINNEIDLSELNRSFQNDVLLKLLNEL